MSTSSTPDPESAPPDSQIDTSTSLEYWNSVSADVDGMLGGYPQVSRIDLQGSKTFIAKVRRFLQSPFVAQQSNGSLLKAKMSLGVDCGAGIGRITTGLLVDVCEVVDIVEPVDKFAAVLSDGKLRKEGRVGDVYVEGLEKWKPRKNYDLIWNQWCVGHLTDAQLVEYLKRAKGALNPDDYKGSGWICVKENLSTDGFGEDIFDDVDSSVTRSDAKFRKIFEEAGLEVIRADLQTGFPKGLGLFPVKMYALR